MYGIKTPVICSDISHKRLLKISDTIIRLGHKNLLPLVMDVRFSSLKHKFDCILVVVPWSHLGVIARRLESKMTFAEPAMTGSLSVNH